MKRRLIVERLRQNHSLEHATMTLLSRRLPAIQGVPGRGPLVAHSDLEGFVVYGHIDTATLQAAAEEALARLQAGEAELALHPNCGTNLVTAGVLSGLAAFLAGSGRRRSLWDRVPSAILGATLALMCAMPLGRWVQTHITTTPNLRGVRIASVERLEQGSMPRHRVRIESRAQW